MNRKKFLFGILIGNNFFPWTSNFYYCSAIFNSSTYTIYDRDYLHLLNPHNLNSLNLASETFIPV